MHKTTTKQTSKLLDLVLIAVDCMSCDVGTDHKASFLSTSDFAFQVFQYLSICLSIYLLAYEPRFHKC